MMLLNCGVGEDSFFFFSFYNFLIYLFFLLALLGLHCSTGFSLVMVSGGYSLVVVQWFLIGRRLLRVPWTARKSNQSILKEISPGISWEGMMLKLKLQYFGHLMGRVD